MSRLNEQLQDAYVSMAEIQASSSLLEAQKQNAVEALKAASETESVR
eukprot:SAG22_NODE_6766_length_814_cov_0.749650_1_plen_46_part_10